MGLICGVILGMFLGWWVGAPEFLKTEETREATKKKLAEQTSKAKAKTADLLEDASNKLRGDNSSKLSHETESSEATGK